MTITKIVQTVNRLLAGERLIYTELEVYLDQVVDEINAKLDSAYPVFSEFNNTDHPGYPDYNFFPDKYLRSVVCIGAADKFYAQDAEGTMTSPLYREAYLMGLFHMERDWTNNIPAAYQAAQHQGHLPLLQEVPDDRGIEVYADF